MKRRPMRAAAWADMKDVVPALTVARQVDLDTGERIDAEQWDRNLDKGAAGRA
jgi:hypothetical protein